MRGARVLAKALAGLVVVVGITQGGVGRGDEPGAAGLEAGAARTDITPPTGYPMWGYAGRHDLPSTGVREPLQARALVLSAGGRKVALVSLDLGRAPTRHTTAAVAARVKEAGIDHVLLAASHTHHGPILELDDWPRPEDSYVRGLERRLADLILEASRATRPARIGVASREVPMNRNRHSRRPDAPVDRELVVVRVEGDHGKVIAHAVNFAAHATMLDSGLREFSPDYPGALASRVERETGAPCLFLQGAAGDLSPRPAPGLGAAEFGRALGDEVVRMAGTLRCEPLAREELRLAEEEFSFRPRLDLGNRLVQRLYGAAFFPALVDFYVREYRDGVRPRLTVGLLGGQIGLVGVSGEFFCGHALSLKRRARLPHLLFVGYCNDYHQYFPTIEAAAEGGYGADVMVAPAEVGAGERVMDRALLHLYHMRRLLPDVPPPPGLPGPRLTSPAPGRAGRRTGRRCRGRRAGRAGRPA